MRRLLFVALITVLAVAGCLGGQEDPGQAGPAGASSGGNATVQEGASTEEVPRAGDETGPMVEKTINLTWEGYLAATADACIPVDCKYVEGPNGEEEDLIYEIGANPEPVSAEFTVTWDGPHSDVHEVLFGLVSDACEDGCHAINWTEGTSGVTVRVEDVNLSEGQTFAILVDHSYRYPAPDTMVHAGPPTEFTVEGHYTVLVPKEGR